MGGGISVEWVKGGFKVLSEFFEGLFGVGNGNINHFVIPGFGIGSTSSSIAHLVQSGHDLGGISGVQG